MTSALVIVDLQNDFVKIIDEKYLANLKQLVDNARTLRHQVIWVYSHYENKGGEYIPWETMDEMCNRTHTGKAIYCKQGTKGAEFIPEVKELMLPTDVTIKKTFYSSFNGTRLENTLRKHRVQNVYIGGVTSTTCVKATTYNACKLGFHVTACSDIIYAFSKGPRHQAAFKEYETFGASVAPNEAVINKTRTFGYGARLHADVIPTDVIDLDYERLKKEIGWCEMISHGAPVPRLVCCQGSIDPAAPHVIPLYRHPVDAQPVVDPWTPCVQRIRDFIAAKIGVDINHVLIQLYRDGTDYIGEHSDKTLDIVAGTPILNFSVGATRNMLVKKKIPGSESEFVPLHHNSLFEFDLVTNEKTRHEIRANKRPQSEFTEEEKRCSGARISFTFRCIGTFLDTTTGMISGQGARKDGNFDAEDFMEMRQAFSEENRTSEFDYAAHYGPGFNAIYVNDAKSRDFVSTRVDPSVLLTPQELARGATNIPVLHFVSGSVPSWKVETLLHEKGIQYEKKREKVMVKLSEKLGEINWRQLTPTLIDIDGTIVRESWAILQYIDAFMENADGATSTKAAVFPVPTPQNKALYARVHELCHAADDLVKKRFAPIEDILICKMSSITDAEAASVPPLMVKFEEELQFWEQEVLAPRKRLVAGFGVAAASAPGGGAGDAAGPAATASAAPSSSKTTPAAEPAYPFVVGNSFTVADISVFCNLGFVIRRGLPLGKYPNIRHYYHSMAKRPSFIVGAPETWNIEKPTGPNIFVRYESRCFGKQGAAVMKMHKQTLVSATSAITVVTGGGGGGPSTQEDAVIVGQPSSAAHVDPAAANCDWLCGGDDESEDEKKE